MEKEWAQIWARDLMRPESIELFYLSIGSAIFFHDPTSLCAQSLQHLVVVAVFGKLVVPLSSKAGVDLSSNRSPSSLSPLVVLPLFPRWHPPRRSASGHRSGQHKLLPLPSARQNKSRICMSVVMWPEENLS